MDVVLRVEGKYLRDARRYVGMSTKISEAVLGIGRRDTDHSRKFGGSRKWKSSPWDEVFAGDVSDASDVTLPTFRRRDAYAEVAGRCLMKLVALQSSQSSVTSDAASPKR
jgi:hypothetical protein